ncbi:MAG: glycosyl hydrolase [Candidatus Sumerlaeota bacterium]|nr:glycosyl hydrolase [Candidatus Sumerlaeota bacterium]
MKSSASRVAGMDGVDNVDGVDHADIYFLANRKPRAEQALCSFRVVDKAPELWRPDTGAIEPMGVYRQDGGLTTEFFSGTATYTKDLHIPAERLGANRRLWLDLGEVKEVAEVKLNGTALGILWKSPYRVEITGAARRGSNRLGIEVTNQWINRMIGDERQFPDDVEWRTIARSRAGGELLEMTELPEWFADWTSGKRPRPSGRFTFEAMKFYSAEDELAPSGLLGPVRLIAAKTLEIPPAE